MNLFVVKHNIEKFLPLFKEEGIRRFTSLSVANQVFEYLSEKIDYSQDEWITLNHIEEVEDGGELHEFEIRQLRLLSDDTKIGVNFKVEDYKY